MTHACRVCEKDFEPTAAAVRKGNWICKKCRAAEGWDYRAANPEKVKARKRAYYATPVGRASHLRAVLKHRALYPKKCAARRAVSTAIRSGKLVPQPCVACGDPKTQAHHPDYSKPLDVVWLCQTCHDELHAHKRNLKQHEVELAALA